MSENLLKKMNRLPSLLNFKDRYNKHLLRGGITLSDNFLTLLLNKKPLRGPGVISWSITYKCNLRCQHCGVWEKKSDERRELETEECLDIIKQAGKLGVWIMSFTGGEPLVRPDLEILIKAARQAGLNVNVNTNGMLLGDKAEMLVKNGVDTITVSVDSHRPEVNDSIRRQPGLTENLERGILKMKELKRSGKPVITVRNVISKKNFREIDDFISYWKDKVDSFAFQPLHHGMSSSFHNVNEEDLLFSLSDRKEFEDVFKKIQKKYHWLRNSYYNQFPDFFFNNDALFHKGFKCYTGFLNLQVDPYGDCFTCAHLVNKVGNLTEQSLYDIWTGTKIKKCRNKIKQKKNDCFCWTNDALINVYMSRIFRKK